MTGGSRIVELRRGAVAGDEGAEPSVTTPAEYEARYAVDADADDLQSPWRDRLIAGAILALAIGWTGAMAWKGWTSLGNRAPSFPEITIFAGALSAPLALLGIVYLLLMRSSDREARRFTRTSAAIRTETQWLEAVIETMATRLEENRAMLSEQSGSFMHIGEDAAARLKVVTDAMRGEVDTIGRQANALKIAAAAARSDMSVLLADLPKAQLHAQRMTEDLKEAGLTAHDNAGALEAQLSSLAARGREADEIAGGAAQRLASHLARMESTSETAGARLEAAAGQMTEAVDAALNRAAEAVDEARKGMEAQGGAMLAMIEQSRAAMDETGEQAGMALSARVEDINARIATLGTALDAHAESSRLLTDALQTAITELDAGLSDLDRNGVERTGRLSAAIVDLSGHTERMNIALGKGGGVADTLIQKAEALLTALDANSRELDESLPAAFDRLDAKTSQSRTLIAALTPEAEKLEMTAVSAFSRLSESETALGRHRETIDSIVTDLDRRITESHSSIETLAQAIGLAGDEATRFAEMAGPQLVEALVRVRETAQLASERAKEALASIIPESAAALARASDAALTETLTERVEAQMAEIAVAAERAVEAAHKASDRLMRQMLTIADTTSAVESRIEEAREEADHVSQDGFARRVALLIESLNSTAIDVTKILSNDVTDTAWAAYLKGDRGVFTRRAVRLLDSGEVREILHHYDEDPEFRDQINRYVHDFEAILRNVLATRDGSPLGVTLLSSDMGKLYVALAQAIERLRT
jgi:hypothetical protein